MPGLLAGLGALVAAGAAAGTEPVTPPVAAGAALVLALVTAYLLRHAIRGHRLRRVRLAWRDADRRRAWLDLPPGEIDPDHLTAYDARDRDDAAAVARDRALAAQARLYDVRLALGALPATVPLVVGFVLVVGCLLSEEPTPDRLLFLGAGLVLLVPAVVVIAVFTVEAWRRQQVLTRASLEAGAYAERHRLLRGEEAGARPRLPRWARALARAAARLGRRNRGVRVVPLLAPGPSALEAPGRHVRLRLDGEVIVLEPVAGGEPAPLPVHDVLGVADAAAPYALAPPGATLLTRGAPVVLLGRGVASDPALAALRERLPVSRHPD